LNPRRHSSIRRLLTRFGILAGLILAVSLLSLTLLDWQHASNSYRRELTTGYRSAQALIEGRLAAARLLAEEAARQAEPRAVGPSGAAILVLAFGGRIVADTSGHSLPRLAALAGRLPSTPLSAVEVDDQGALVAVGAVLTGGRLSIATLPFTPADVQAIKDATGLETSLFAGQTRVATTLRDGAGQPGTATPLSAASLAALEQGAGRPHLTEERGPGRQQYRHILAPLYGLDGSLVGAYAVSQPWAGFWPELLQRRWTRLAVLLASIALTALLTVSLRQRLLRPIGALQRDLAFLASRQGAGPPAANYGLRELDELLQHVNQLDAARAALAHNSERLNERLIQNQTLAVLGQLAAGVAHDLNNPLTTILGLADIILSSNPDSDTQRDVTVIHRQAERSGSMVRSLLSFARRHRDDPQWVSVNELISQTLELLAYQARVSSIRCEARLDQQLPLTWADPSQMQQVFFNLLNNALQAVAGAGGRGNVRIESSWSSPTPQAPYGLITVRVHDDGPGIAQDALPRLFQPYFTTKGSTGGTGLGLSIASDVVRRHSGRIWAENNPHAGACFTVQLPVTPEPRQATAGAGPGTAGPGRGPGYILLADSDPRRLGLLTKVLRRLGYPLITAGDGLLARSRLESEPFDLVVCGLELLRLDGRELYAWARVHRPELAGRFIFLIDAEITSELEGFLQASRARVLLPPFHEDAVRAIVNQALQ